MRSVFHGLLLVAAALGCSPDADRPDVPAVADGIVGAAPAAGRVARRAVPKAVVGAPQSAAAKPGGEAKPGTDPTPGPGSATSGGREGGAPGRPIPPGERTQFVLLSFDTTPSWQSKGPCSGFCSVHRALNRDRDPSLPPNSFTLFISTGGMQLSPERRRPSEEERPFLGVAPPLAPVYKYADTLRHLLSKAERIRQLDELGVELASHSVRHLHGEAWTQEQWRSELSDHLRILDLVGLPHPLGFRAPFLGWSEGLYPALEASGARYDSSQVTGRSWPRRFPGTKIWVFGLPTVAVPDRGRVLFFDDNVRSILKSAASDAGVTGEDHVREWIENAYVDAAWREFRARYTGDRAPFLVTGHGNFLEPMLRLMRRVCPLEGVRCATFREAAAYMDEHPELEGVGDPEEESAAAGLAP